MRHGLAVFGCALMAFLIQVSSARADVVFGPPSATDYSDGDTVSWSMNVPGSPPYSGWIGTVAYHAINTKGTGAANGRVVPSSQSYSINTKGAGTNGRFYFPPPVVVGTGTLSLSVQQSPTLADPTLQVLVNLTGADAMGTAINYQPVLFTWQGIPLNGATLSSAPSIVLDSDANGIGFSDDVSLTVPGGTDPSTETWEWKLSAQTVPEPASGSILAAALAGLASRRRRFAHR